MSKPVRLTEAQRKSLSRKLEIIKVRLAAYSEMLQDLNVKIKELNEEKIECLDILEIPHNLR